jgi:hypothetical protein
LTMTTTVRQLVQMRNSNPKGTGRSSRLEFAGVGCVAAPVVGPITQNIEQQCGARTRECLRMFSSCETRRPTMRQSLAELGADTALTSAAPKGRA